MFIINLLLFYNIHIFNVFFMNICILYTVIIILKLYEDIKYFKYYINILIKLTLIIIIIFFLSFEKIEW